MCQSFISSDLSLMNNKAAAYRHAHKWTQLKRLVCAQKFLFSVYFCNYCARTHSQQKLCSFDHYLLVHCHQINNLMECSFLDFKVMSDSSWWLQAFRLGLLEGWGFEVFTCQCCDALLIFFAPSASQELQSLCCQVWGLLNKFV